TGLQWKKHKGTSPWVAQFNFESMQSIGNSDQIPHFETDNLYQAEGFLNVPDDSKIILHLETHGQVVIKIHDNVVIDHNPKQKSISNSYELNLAKGYHPVRIYAMDMNKDDYFELSWTINGKRSVLQNDSCIDKSSVFSNGGMVQL
ncbi:MAG: hypothetical protein KAS71_07540, partial [Bacteroidales bacterium]|nr:hypothetical protein [Bacteroidales bacterium]